MPCPIGTVPIVEPDHWSSGSANPGDSPGKSIPVGFPKPKRSIQDDEAPFAEPLRDEIVPMFDEYSTIWRTLYPHGSARVRLADDAVGDAELSAEAGTSSRGVTVPSSSAAATVTSLNVEPGLVRVRHGPVAPPVRACRREAVRVVARRGRHGEDRAGLRVHHDRRGGLRAVAAHRVGEHVLGVRLDLVVDREPDVLARRLRPHAHDVERTPLGVLDDRLAPRPPREHLVERPLEPFQPLVVHACIAEHDGRHAVPAGRSGAPRGWKPRPASSAARASRRPAGLPCARGTRSPWTCR